MKISSLFSLLLIISTMSLSACSRDQKAPIKTITVEQKSLSNVLFYSGTIQPLHTWVITSPTDGIVVDMPFQYGEHIKKNQLLFQLSSAKFLADYKTAFMQYLKAKNDFMTSQSQLTEATFLHKNQLISDDDYKMKQSGFYSSRLALLQAKDALANLLQQVSIKDKQLYQLTIADIDQITKALHIDLRSENLAILSPYSGVILAPNKTDNDNKKITKGDAIKQGDALAVIGEMEGISVHIKVNELTVNQLTPGQPVKITGIAFPDETLMGKIIRVDQQGDTSTGGIPVFSVEAIVPTLTPSQQNLIRVGMSAKVEIDINEKSQTLIPITAVREKNGASFVRLYNEKTKKSFDVAIKTGKTTVDSVTILSGLSAGDKIVIPD